MIGNIMGTMLSGAEVQSAVSAAGVRTKEQAEEIGLNSGQIRSLERSGQIECATCAARKYQDGSDEMVSFKAAAHISPTAAGAAVRSHEQEHVSNAYKDAAMNNGKVLRASVAIHTSICPECGRTYVSGGETTTKIAYNQDGYSQGAKIADQATIPGMNFDMKLGDE